MRMMMRRRRRRRIVPNMKRDQITSLLATILPTGSSTRQHINRSFPEIQHSSHFTSVENDLSECCSHVSRNWCVDKMPTGQNANRTKCQPRLAFCPGLFFHGWHFVRTNFLVGILSGPSQHVLAPPPNIREWGGSL